MSVIAEKLKFKKRKLHDFTDVVEERNRIKAQNKRKPAKNAVGRPRIKSKQSKTLYPKEINLDVVYNLARIHCTKEEIAACFSVSVDAIGKVKGFDAVWKEGQRVGKSSLRRRMWKAAIEGNVPMMIWLSKNVLDYKEPSKIEVAGDPNRPIKTEEVESARAKVQSALASLAAREAANKSLSEVVRN